MLLTEEQAKEKWCPFVRTVKFTPTSLHGIANLVQGNALGNRLAENMDELPGVTRCIASQCMAWRKLQKTEIEKNGSFTLSTEATGYCGLAGLPLP